MSNENKNPVLELIAVCLIVFFLFFDFIMGVILKGLLYFFLVIGSILLFAGLIGLCHRVVRGVQHLLERKDLQETMIFVSGVDKEGSHE